MNTPARVTILLLIAGVLGAVANLVSPHRIAWREDWARHVETAANAAGMPLVTLAETQAIVAKGTHILLDARSLDAYAAGHLPGAMSLPADAMEQQFPQFAGVLDANSPLLVYCSGIECDESLRLGTFLHEQGFTNVVLFAAGYAAWSAETAAP